MWNCENNIWGKPHEGAECERNCDCGNTDETYCVQTLYDPNKKICCNQSAGECAKDVASSCTSNSYCCPNNYLTNYKGKSCQCNDGAWSCANKIIETDYSRILFSKNANKYETTLEIKKAELEYINSASAKLLVFFDKGSYTGNIQIKGGEDCSPININSQINEKIIENLGSVSTTEGFNCRLEISTTGMGIDDYFFYTGSALVLEYT